MTNVQPLVTMHETAEALKPMGLDLPPAPSWEMPDLPHVHLPNIDMRTVGVVGVAVVAGVGGIIGLSRADKAIGATEDCPKPAGLLASPRNAPNPGAETGLGQSGVASIRVTSLGVEGGYGCIPEKPNVGFLVENTGDTIATNLRLYLNGRESLNIVKNSVEVNGQLPVPGKCEFGQENAGSCVIDDSFLPGEQIYVDVATQKDTKGVGILNLMSVSDTFEQNYDDNSVEQSVPVYETPVIIKRSALKTPKFIYGDRFRPGAKKGQKNCRNSTVYFRIATNQPPAFNVKLQLSPKGNLKFQTGVRSFNKRTSAGDISRERYGYATIRACTIGRRAVVGFMRVSSDNTDPTTWRTNFNPLTNKWKVIKAKTPKGSSPALSTAPSR